MQISTKLRTALGCLAILLFTVNTSLIAQTLHQGDMAVIGLNTETDKVHIATLVNMTAGTVIKITDRGWDNSTNAFTILNPSNTGDGIVTWTLTSDVPAGTVLELFLGGADDGTKLTNLTSSADFTSDITITGYLSTNAIIGTGEQIFIYQGADSNPFFIFGMNNSAGPVDATNWNTSVGFALRDSQLPNGSGSQNVLINGVNALGLPGGSDQKDNVQYSGPTTSADRDTWLARFTDLSNWSGSDADNLTNPIISATTPMVDIGSGTNSPPTVTGLPASIEITEDQIGNLDIASSTFADADNDEITVSLSVSKGKIAMAATGGRPVELGGNGTATITVTGMPDGVNGYLDFPTNVTYIPPANLNGNAAAILTVSVNDGSGDVELGTIPINITAVNDPPTAVDDNVTTDEGSQVAGNALTNDSDVDGDVLTASLVTGPVHGDVIFNANGSFTYTPSTGYSGPDSLQYKVCDGQSPSLCDTAWVHVTIEAVNNVPTDISLSSTTVNQSGGTNAIVGTLSTNDFDVGDTHTYSLVSGTVSADNNSFNIDGSTLRANDAPAMAAGTYNVRIQTTDNNGGKYQKPFTIMVVDDIAPTVDISTSKTSLKAGETATLSFNLTESSTNFTEDDVTVTDGVLSGFSGSGTSYSATFTPSGNATVTATIDVNAGTFTDAAGNNNIAAGQVTIAVDTEAPSGYTVSIDQSIITLANQTALSFTFSGVEIGATFDYEITSVLGGTPVVGNGTIVSANQQVSNIDVSGLGNGKLTLRITLTDGSGNEGAPATDNVIKAVNYPPLITTSGGTTTFTEPADGEPISVTVDDELTVSDPDNSMLAWATVAIMGNFQDDQDILDFVNDGSTMGNIMSAYNSTTGVLSLTSNLASATLAEWQAALRAVNYSNTSGNPNTDDRIISFIVDDANDSSAPATKVIHVVAVNTAPVALDDAVTVNEDIPATGNVLTNDSDAEGDAFTASRIDGPFNGTVVLNADGSFTYTPNGNYNGLDSLKYQVCDNGTPFRCDTAWVRFTVAAINDAPKITSNGGGSTASVDVLENTSTVTTVTAIDDDGDTLAFSINGGADAAEFSIDAGTGELTFKSAPDFENPRDADGDNLYEVEVMVSDENDSDTQMISVRVSNVNDAPVNTVPVSQTIDQYETLVFSTANGNAVSVADVDAGGGTVRVTLAATNGLLTLSGTTGLTFVVGSGTDDGTMTFDGTLTDINTALNGLTFTPTSGYNGVAGLQVTTDDLGLSGSGGAKKDTDLISITVNSVSPVVMAVGSENPDGTYKTDDNIKVTVTFDQAVRVDESGGSPSLLLETGDTDREAVYEAGSGSETLTFTYTVQAGDESTDLDYQSTAALTLNGATIQNVSGDNVVLTLPAVGGAASIAGQHAIVIDGVAPQVSSVEVPDGGYYLEGGVLAFTVHVDDEVAVDVANGTPYLELTVGSTIVQAAYAGGSGSDILTFSYAVQAGDLDMDGVSLGDAIVMNGGNIHDEAGNDIIAALNNMGSTTGVLVNTIHPEVTLSTDAGSTVNAPFIVAITFSEAVTDFVLGDITAANATLSDLRTSDNITYTCLVTPLSRGLMELSVAADIAVNIAGNGNLVSDVLSVQFNEMVGDITLADSSFVYDGTAKSLVISGNLPEDASVSYENNSRTNVGTQEVTATISGDNYETLVLRADLTVTEASIEGIALRDSSFVYDGTAKSLKITGTLPNGTSVNYENNNRTNVGTQEVRATISGDNYEMLVLTADLTVTEASIEGIALRDSSFVYDGTAKLLTITGTLPNGTSVNYENNNRTNIGTQEVRATISGDNYETLVLRAGLTVTEASIEGIALRDSSFVYDGTAKSLKITGTLPDGTSVSYENNSRTNVGTQEVTATISGDNYETLVLTAGLTVTEASIEGIALRDSSFVYDGTAKSLTITGTLPDGTSVSYENNSRTKVGTQEVTATISGDNYETLVLTAGLTVTEASIEGIVLRDSSFIYDGTAKSLKITGTLPNGTSVNYENNNRTDVGSQEVRATISGDNYEDLVLTAELTVRSNQRSIDFPAIADRVYGDVPFSLKATSSSDEAVSYTSSDPSVAEVSATGEVTIMGAGTATITATVPENANYANRPSVSRTFTVAKAVQTISFGEVGEVSRDAGSIPLDVENSSGLPVSLSVDDEQVATVDGTTLDILRLGTVRVTATQAGDDNYLPAEPVTITVRVIDENDALSLRVHKALSPNGDGINEFLMVEGIKEYPENRLVIVNRNGNKITEIEGYNNEDRVFRGVGRGNELLSSGTYYYLLEVKIDGEWKYRKGYFVIRY